MQNVGLTKKTQSIIKQTNLLLHIKMGKKNVTFGDIKIEKYKFYYHKSPIF